MARRIWPLLLLVVLVACSSNPRSTSEKTGDDADARAAARETPAGETMTATGGDFRQLDFSVRGGVAGFMLDLSLTGEGEAVLRRRGEELTSRTLLPSVLDELGARLAAARPLAASAAGQAAPETGRRVADAMHRELQVETAAGSWSISDPAGQSEPPPAPVRELFATLMEITIGMQAAAMPDAGH